MIFFKIFTEMSLWYFLMRNVLWGWQVHRLDRESSGIILMGRTKESIAHLQWLFSDGKRRSSCKAWDNACEASYQRYWALVIGSPKEKQGFIHAPLSKVLSLSLDHLIEVIETTEVMNSI